MTQPSDSNRIDRMENDIIDLKLAVSALISTTETHQRSIETLAQTMNAAIRAFVERQETTDRRLESIESDIRGLQTENRRILDILQHRNTDDV
jgi:hypothetical protein